MEITEKNKNKGTSCMMKIEISPIVKKKQCDGQFSIFSDYKDSDNNIEYATKSLCIYFDSFAEMVGYCRKYKNEQELKNKIMSESKLGKDYKCTLTFQPSQTTDTFSFSNLKNNKYIYVFDSKENKYVSHTFKKLDNSITDYLKKVLSQTNDKQHTKKWGDIVDYCIESFGIKQENEEILINERTQKTKRYWLLSSIHDRDENKYYDYDVIFGIKVLNPQNTFYHDYKDFYKQGFSNTKKVYYYQYNPKLKQMKKKNLTVTPKINSPGKKGPKDYIQ